MFDLFCTGDWHLGLEGNEDTCITPWVNEIIDAFDKSNCKNLLLLGDILELLKHNVYDVLHYNRELIEKLAVILMKKQGKVWFTIGNHENIRCNELKYYLYVCGLGNVNVAKNFHIGKFYCTHGSEFDWWTRGPQHKVSRALTWFAGNTLEKIPGFQEKWINPTVWFSPAHPSNDKQEEIHAEAEEYAKRELRGDYILAFGHTHYYTVHQGLLCNPGGPTVGHYPSWLELDTESGLIHGVEVLV